MKTKYIPLFALLATVACNQEDLSTEIAKLNHEKDSLLEVDTRISERITEIDELLAAEDTTRKQTPVTVAEVQVSPFAHFFEVYGAVSADKNITIYPESAGLIKNIAVREGQTVSQGQLLVEIDDAILTNSINEVKTNLELATTLYEKQKALWDKGIGSEVQYLESKNRKESLESKLATLRSQIAQTKIRAPFGGVIDQIFPKEGEYAAPQSPMLRLMNLSDVYVSADIPESYVSKINVNNLVNINIPSMDMSFDTKINQVGQFINPDNRTFRVRIDLQGHEKELKPNQLVSVKIRDYKTDSAIVVPNHMIQQDPQGNSYVYVFNQFSEGVGTVEKAIIEVGKVYNAQTEVVKGLKPGQLLIDKGSRSVQAGQKVRRIESNL